MRSKTIGSGTAGNNTGSATADYTSVASWESSIADVDDETGTIITKVAPTDSTQVTINAASTARAYLLTADSTCAVVAATRAEAGAKARLVGAVKTLLTISTTGVTVEKVAFTASGAAAGYEGVVQVGDAATIRRGIVIDDCGGSNSTILLLSSANGKTVVVDNVAEIGTSGSGIGSTPWVNSGTLKVYHGSLLLVSGSYAGYYSAGSGTLECRACVVQGKTGGNFGGDGTAGGDFNVSQDATAPGVSATSRYRSTTGWFNVETSGSEDLSLATAAKGKWVTDGKDAIDQSGWPADVATDIVGTVRSAPIDPGVWQTPGAVGGSSTPIFFNHLQTQGIA